MIRVRAFLVALVVVASVGLVAPASTATAADCTFPVTSTDATGTTVTVQEEPERIVTLNPSAAQTMWEIGAEEKVIGLSSYASYLDGAENRTVVMSGFAVNVEVVVNATPDLVLAPNTIRNDTVDQLRNAGLTVYKFGMARSTVFIREKTVLIGRLVGECQGAADREQQMADELDTIREAVAGADRPRVLYVSPSGWTAGSGTFVDTIITTAGGQNVAAEAGISGYAEISEEIVVAEDPEWIVVTDASPTVPDTPAYDGTTAVQEGNVVAVDGNYLSQPAPRIVQPMLTIVKALHPDAYEAASRGVQQIRDEGPPERPPPSFEVTSTSLDVSRAELHETATVEVEVTNDGGKGTFEAGLYLDDSRKETRYVQVPGGGSATVRFEHTLSSWGEHVVRVNDHEVGTVTVVKDLEDGENATDSTSNATATTTPNASMTATPSATPTATPTEGSPTSPAATDGPATRGDSSGAMQGTGSTPSATALGSPTSDGSTTQSGGQAGFGVGVGVVGVVAAGLLRRRSR